MSQLTFLKKHQVRALLALEEQLQSNYSEDKLCTLVSRQNQNPGSSLFLSNLNWLTLPEILVLIFIAYTTDVEVVRFEILERLPKAIRRIKHPTSPQLNGLLLRLLEELGGKKTPFWRSWQEVFFTYIPYRKLRGLLTDTALRQKVAKRLRPRLVRPRKPVQAGRVRGYRDHGTSRPEHKWLPREDYKFNLDQWEREQMQSFEDHLYEAYLCSPFSWCCHPRDRFISWTE